MKIEDFKFDPKFVTRFNDNEESQVTIDQFIDFLNDMKKKGLDKDAKLNICGSGKFFFHYNSDKKIVCLDTDSLSEEYIKNDPKSLYNGRFRLDYNEEEWLKAKVYGFNAEYSGMRINKKSIPKGKYFYEIAHDNDYGNPTRVTSNYIVENFYGTIITDHPLPLDKNNQLYLEKGDFQIVYHEPDWR